MRKLQRWLVAPLCESVSAKCNLPAMDVHVHQFMAKTQCRLTQSGTVCTAHVSWDTRPVTGLFLLDRVESPGFSI